MSFEVEFQSFVFAIQQYLEEFNDSYLKRFIEDWPSEPYNLRQTSPHHLPVLSFLPAVIEAAHDQSENIIQTLVSLSPKLTWGQTYTKEDFGSGFLQRYGWTELIGQRGPIPSDRLACGFLLLGPQLVYPRHSHEAQEIYIPMTTGSLWQRNRQEWTSGAAGKPRHHVSWEWHAMRTKNQPLLALYLWRGGKLIQKSRVAP